MSGEHGYRRGDRVALEHTADPHTRLRPGDQGTVAGYDPRHGHLAVRWDSGSTLTMLLHDGDQVRLLAAGGPAAGGEAAGPAGAPAAAAPDEAVLREARATGRRHGRAAVYWQTGDSGTGDARAFYRELLRGIAESDPAITGLYEVPALTGDRDYDRENLAADLGLAPGSPALDRAVREYETAAREEFWAEAARLARRRLEAAPGGTRNQEGRNGAGPRDGEAEEPAPEMRQDITDPATGLSRLLSERCPTCILRPSDPMFLGPARTAAFVRCALDAGSYVVCHETLTYGDHPDYGPAICRGFFNAYAGRSRSLLILRAFGRLTEVPPPPAPGA